MTQTNEGPANATSIPTIEAAPQHHDLRIFHWVKQLMRKCLDPEVWGWNLTTNGLLPITTAKPPTPRSSVA